MARSVQTMIKTPISFEKYFQGRGLLIARVIWIMLFLISLVVLFVFVINFYASEYKWSQACSLMPIEDQSNCVLTQQAYHQLGIPLEFRSIYFSIGVVIQVSSWILVGLLIFSKSSHKPFEFFFSLMLVISGTLTLDPTIPAEIRLVYPAFSPLLAVMELLGSVLMVVWYLFPDGRFAPGWMRWVGVFFIAFNFRPTVIPDRLWPTSLSILVVISVVATFIFSFIYRYHKISNSLQRQQIKWVIASLSVFMVVAIVWELHYSIFPASAEPGISQVLWSLTVASLFFLTRALIAASIAIAILRYRLWDIDFIINRSMVYGALTIILLAIFAGSLLLVSSFIQGQSFVIAFGVTALIAGMLFNPAHRRIQRFVDQLYHINIDYQKVLPSNPASSDVIQALRQTDFVAYRNLELIGRGNTAEVYKSTHPKLNQPVAIKILFPHLAEEAEFQERFTREVLVISKLTHSNIVRVFDSGKADGKHYMVLEYLTGQDLDKFIRANGRLSLSQALPLVEQIASALDYAHTQGFIHRDIKPSNVFLDTSKNFQRAIITDFGFAKIITPHTAMTHTSRLIGTFDYIAPEQIQESPNIDGRADIYALGITVYQMLTGELPFKHQNSGALLMAHLNQPPPNPCEILPSLPAHVARKIQRAMAKKPDDRFKTATEFWQEISASEF